MSISRPTSKPHPLTRADRWARAVAFGIGVLLVSAFVFVVVDVFRHDNEVANCRTTGEIIALLGDSKQTFTPPDESWRELCQSWGCKPLHGEAQRFTRIELHESPWLWTTGYLVFYDNEAIVAIYALGNG